MRKTILALSIISLLIPARSAFADKHKSCNLCHQKAEEQKYELVVSPNYNEINPSTGRHFAKEDAICMACHSPFKAKTIHPVGVVPVKVNLPPESKISNNYEDDRIGCGSCHDIHGGENSYKYLRWEVHDKIGVAEFCVYKCHTSMAKATRKFDRLALIYGK